MQEQEKENRCVEMSSYALEAAREFCPEEEETLTEKKARENDGTMVTVVCITYGHENYIAQALDSFLAQKTDFKYKIFVGEDKGPDRTADIVRDYAARYPDRIVPFIREENMGPQRNMIDLCQRACSPYIALCDGDDYWIDPYKLQKQVDYMEANPEYMFSSGKTEISAQEEWLKQRNYKPNEEGKYILPDCLPGYKLPEPPLSAWNVMDHFMMCQTSSYFFRWNYDIDYPEWFFRGVFGDIPLRLMQMGNRKAGYITDVVSVYRVNESGVFSSYKTIDDLFLKTRTEYIRWMSGILSWYEEHEMTDVPRVRIENRIKLETANYLKVLLKRGDTDKIRDFIGDYPDAAQLSLQTYLGFYHDQRAMSATFGWDGYQLVARDRVFRHAFRPFVRLGLAVKKLKNKIKKLLSRPKGIIKNLASFFLYWINTGKKKEQDLWVFSGFNKKSYMDNSKYFYEYVLEHHPEIRAYWLTLSKDVYRQLQEEGKPVLMMRTGECRRIVSRASIAVTDHYRMSDYDAFSGLNDKLKIVQLWHGVGLKSIGDLKNTTVPGVTYSDDILPAEGDSKATLALKKLKYIRHAYYRELFEHYFLLACPGQERVEQVAKPLHIPLEACFFSGHPRNILLHQTQPDEEVRKILYAPTYRWSAKKEKQLVRQIADSADEIQQRMEERNTQLVLRLHPHTWRNYSRILDRVADTHDRILVDHEKDVYTTLGTYSIVISDYSSIAYDFILLDRPVIFFNYDFEDFVATECALNYDYDEYSPGQKTKTWTETLDQIEAYLDHPEQDGAWRRKVRDEFYMMDVNDENNSERIVREIERRLAAE